MNLAIAKKYGEYGARVAVMSRSPERCAKAASEIEALGAEAIGLPCDVRDYDAVAKSMAETAARFGKIDLVVAGQAGNFYAPVDGYRHRFGRDLQCI
jgi:NAD(P)-dependent dehydrogenase (short-subunit alcohol dehydrogenase family)